MPTALSDLPVHRLDFERYHAMVEAGVFGDDRIELLEGVLVEMSPKGREHEELLAWLNRKFVSGLDERFQIRVQMALTLASTGSEPEPDLAIVGPDASRPYHPAEALLVIEVAASSLRYDRGVKAAIYAAAGIPEYWVVDVAGEVVEVRTRPAGGGFEDAREASAGAVLLPGALPGPSVDVSELFAAAHR
jgi:Uma2 family endonuclease